MSRATAGGRQTGAWTSRAAFAVEAAGTALLAYLLAQLVWVAYPPFVETASAGLDAVSSPALALSSADINPFARAGAFASTPAATVVEAPQTTLNLILLGVRSASGDAEGEGGGSAVIQTPDNRQRLYRVGDEIVGGVTLASVAADRVIILRDGQPESVTFAQRASIIGSSRDPQVAAAAPTTLSTTAPAEASGAVSAEALMNGVAPLGSADGGVLVGPRGDGAAFAAAGLQQNDVVLSINGAPVSDPDALGVALAGVGPGSTVAIDARRAGAPVTIRFVLE